MSDTLVDRIIHCRICPRLVAWREQVAIQKRRAYRDWEYWGKPITGFGDPEARVLVVGLAPGAHGANRTGRVFTGDDSGAFLFGALCRAGFANQPVSTHIGDGLELKELYITAVCRCVPPDNKPLRDEIENCRPFLVDEIANFKNLSGFVALGKIALDGLLAALPMENLQRSRIDFVHGKIHSLGQGSPWLVTSYHPSRQNTQTGRLTPAMFDQIWNTVRDLLVE